jgi:hypothetical protein
MAERRLCEKFFDHLYQIKIDPTHQAGWGTISAADFKSKRGQYIDPNVDRMQQVRNNKDIIIQSFKSELRNHKIDRLDDFYNIKFRLLADSGINIAIPALKMPLKTSNLQYETVLYDFARQSYYRIVGNEELYEAIPEEYGGQLRLL